MNVFVMIPFQKEFTDTYQKAIAPAVRATGMEPVILAPVIGTNQVPGPIDAQIIDAIKTSHFGIADLTGHNANVMYEIAYAHSLEKLVIIITQDSPGDTPFDVRHHRIIYYSPTEYEALRNDLQKSIDSILTADGSEVKLLRRALVPLSIDTDGVHFVVAANPLSYRAAYRQGGGWKDTPRTGGDYVGIRGLIQSFGLIYGLGKLPELVNPDDFDDVVYEKPYERMNLYTIGSPKANRWAGMLMRDFFKNRAPHWEFKPDPESDDITNPRAIIRQDGQKYSPPNALPVGRTRWDYGLVIRGPHPKDTRCMFLIMAGRSALGTAATCLAVTAPGCLSLLNQQLNLQGINLNNHKQAFCAVVSICAENRVMELSSFAVHDIFAY